MTPHARMGRDGEPEIGERREAPVDPPVPEPLDAEYTRRMRAVVAEINAIGERVKAGVGTHGSPNSGEAMTGGIFADAKRMESGIDTYAAQIRAVLTLPEWKPPVA